MTFTPKLIVFSDLVEKYNLWLEFLNINSCPQIYVKSLAPALFCVLANPKRKVMIK